MTTTMITTMTTPYYCLLIAVMLPYMLAGGSVYFRRKQTGSVNLKQPRTQANILVDGGARIVAAQANAWEALVVFGAALLVATIANVDPETVSMASLIFVAARVGHGVFYVADVAPLRVISFVTGLASCLSLFISALF